MWCCDQAHSLQREWETRISAGGTQTRLHPGVRRSWRRAVCPDGHTLLSRGQIFLWRPGWQRVRRLCSKALDGRGCDLRGRPSTPQASRVAASPHSPPPSAARMLPDTEPTAPLGSGPGSQWQLPHSSPACLWYLLQFNLIVPFSPLVSRVCWSYDLKSNFPL